MEKKKIFGLRITAILTGLFLTTCILRVALSQDIASATDKTETNPYLIKGVEYFTNGQYQEAIDQFQKAIQSDPEDAKVYTWLGCAYDLLGNEEKYMENIQKAKELYKKAGNYQAIEELNSELENVKNTKKKASGREAIAHLKLIWSAEKIAKLEKKSYVSCNSTADCNSKLNLRLPSDNWEFYVFTDDRGKFCAEAKGNKGTSNWVIKEDGEPIEGICR